MIEEIKDPVLRSFLTELVGIANKAKDRGLQLRLIGPAAVYLHILDCKECVELYERLLTGEPVPLKAPAPKPAPKPVPAPPAKTEVRRVAEVKPEAKPLKAPEAPPKPAAPEVSIAEDPRALEDEVLMSMLMLKSQLIATLKVEFPSKELVRYVAGVVGGQVRDMGESCIYVSIRVPDKHVRLLYSKGRLVGARIDLSDGTVLNGRDALGKLTETEEVIKARAYVFRVPEDLAKQFGF